MSQGPSRPPERIELDTRVLLRARYSDAAAVATAVTESFAELEAWLPWVTTYNASLAGQRAHLLDSEAEWERGDRFEYQLLDREARLLGFLGLMHRAGPGALALGYWAHTAHAGNGHMTAAARALTDAALRLRGVHRVEIHCDAANHASAAIPRRLGYRHLRTEDRVPGPPAETGRMMIWAKPRE